jgi:hypothetical protein
MTAPPCPACGHPLTEIRQQTYDAIQWEWDDTRRAYLVYWSCGGDADKPRHVDCDSDLSRDYPQDIAPVIDAPTLAPVD